MALVTEFEYLVEQYGGRVDVNETNIMKILTLVAYHNLMQKPELELWGLKPKYFFNTFE